MKKDSSIFLRHILEQIELIEHDTKGKTKEQFEGNALLHDAIVRRIEIIGEAAKI